MEIRTETSSPIVDISKVSKKMEIDLEQLENRTERASSSFDGTAMLELAKAEEEIREKKLMRLDATIEEKVKKDKSLEAKRSRQVRALRAAYGEFMCTFLFLTPILGAVANMAVTSPDNTLARGIVAAFVSGFQAIGVSFAFSSVSGAHFNPAISFALWLTRKLSNRKASLYIFVQFLASIVSMSVVAAIFPNKGDVVYRACTVLPPDEDRTGKIFATEFFLTFMFTYVAFTVVFEDAEQAKKDSMSFKSISDSKGLTVYASTPQSKTGFAPFAIGFTIFSLNLIGGSSGGAFNPARMFGPAIFSGKFTLMHLYFFAQFFGAACAALLVKFSTRLGFNHHPTVEPSAIEVIENLNSKSLNTKKSTLEL
jgi:glycerol uptake facilitator-like aquaporin